VSTDDDGALRARDGAAAAPLPLALPPSLRLSLSLCAALRRVCVRWTWTHAPMSATGRAGRVRAQGVAEREGRETDVLMLRTRSRAPSEFMRVRKALKSIGAMPP